MRQYLPMILIRVVVGLVFILEGALKFLWPDQLGVAHFAAIGLPYSHQLAPLVGGIEICGGFAVMLNFFAGDAAFILLGVILGALITTKIPILMGGPLGPFTPEKFANLPYGWLSFLHAARTDLCLFFSLLAVLIDSGMKMGKRRRWYQGS